MRKTLLAALLLVAGCGKDTTGPSIPNIAGTWIASWSNMSGSNVTCSASGVTLSVTQSQETFSGTYSMPTVTCNGTPSGPYAGTVVTGVVGAPSSVAFDMDSPDFHQSGTFNGNSMSGNASWKFNVSGTIIPLVGTWSAVKQ